MRVRVTIAVLTALAIAVAPVGSARASMHAANAGQTDSKSDMAGMSDCAKMAQEHGQKPSKSDCPCCDTKNTCAPELCPAKCFKAFGQVVHAHAVLVLVSLHLRPAEPNRPPDWLHAPQPPPPRT